MKLRITNILILIFFPVSIILTLFFASSTTSQRLHHFNRTFLFDNLRLIKVFDIRYNSYYISGIDVNHVYLGNETTPLFGVTVNASLGSLNIFQIKNISKWHLRSARLVVDSPYFYLNDEIPHTIYRGTIKDWQIRHAISSGIFADLVVPISGNSLVLRTINNEQLGYSFGRIVITPREMKSSTRILPEKENEIFATDGMLDFCKGDSILVYVYYYKNQFVSLDTNLRLLHTRKTVDAASSPKLKIVKIKSENAYTIAQPPRFINRRSCINNKRLFIHSPSMADNEDPDAFKRSSVVDVYDLVSGVYRFSFYIPDYKNSKIKDFRILNDKLYFISDRYLVIYQMNKAM